MGTSFRCRQVSAAIETATATVQTFSPLALLWIGSVQVLDGTMSLGTMLALNALAMSILVPLGSLVACGQQWQLAATHLERIADVMETAPEQGPPEGQVTPSLRGRVELRRVGFRFDANGPMILQDVSFIVRQGQKVALVGPSGSGKSTLARLLLGLYPPSSGEILYDGTSAALNYRALRRQCGVVLQEPFLFCGSIRDNIAFGDPGVSLESVMDAARLAAIHDEIVQMPMGYETRVPERGIGLSGGQRQRLALARALVHRPTVLVLDEATSHLDAVTESRVDQNLSSLACTRIVIAHRLSTVRTADLILVLDRGRVVERGTHEQLLADGRSYATLVGSQT
jgi:ABC-type bacteriocin/lantibiotic exporter with double-glycine peptidase domain